MKGLLERWIDRRVIVFLRLPDIISNMGFVMQELDRSRCTKFLLYFMKLEIFPAIATCSCWIYSYDFLMDTCSEIVFHDKLRSASDRFAAKHSNILYALNWFGFKSDHDISNFFRSLLPLIKSTIRLAIYEFILNI